MLRGGVWKIDAQLVEGPVRQLLGGAVVLQLSARAQERGGERNRHRAQCPGRQNFCANLNAMVRGCVGTA